MAERVCPVWVGYLLASPLRKLFENPNKMLGPYIGTGMTVLDIGCAMGFFSLPAARMTGPNGKVICVDLQEKMIQKLEKRAKRAGLSGIIDTRICPQDSLGLGDLAGQIDFAMAIAVVHEVPDAPGFFSDVFTALKPDGKLLVCEPAGHVKPEAFEVTVSAAEQKGFEALERPEMRRSHSAVFGKASA